MANYLGEGHCNKTVSSLILHEKESTGQDVKERLNIIVLFYSLRLSISVDLTMEECFTTHGCYAFSIPSSPRSRGLSTCQHSVHSSYNPPLWLFVLGGDQAFEKEVKFFRL